MSVLDVMESRFSVRKFTQVEVEQEKIDKILRAGQVAPTACNLQPQRIYLIKSKDGLEKLQKCKTSHFGETLAFLVCYDKDACWIRDYDGKCSGEIDATIVSTHMMLQAQELGVCSTWVMHFIPEAVKKEFDLPDNIIPVSLLVMGYPDKDAVCSRMHFDKKPLSETVKSV